MIATTILAHVQEILKGHSERALLVAVDGEGHQVRLEVPSESVRAMKAHETMLVLSWSLHPLPLAAHEMQAPAEPTPTGAMAMPASAVDQEFMALMAGRHGTPAAPAAPGEPAAAPVTAPGTAGTTSAPTTSTSSTTTSASRTSARGLAELLGVTHKT